ncbi:MAG: TolC family protein [Lachnospiraceae bacterium]|nr:TolC family protein [Lachnospiraceae bacterium]
MKHLKHKCIRIIALLLMPVLLSAFLPEASAWMPAVSPMEAQAAQDRLLSMRAVRALAIAASPECDLARNKIEGLKAKLESAQKAIRLKKKNMRTFRWSPLISFKFPTKPNQQQAYEFQFKPISIQAEIDVAYHDLTDQRLAVSEEVNTLYVEIVYLQRRIDFYETRIEVLGEGIRKARARLVTGGATQADVEKLEKKKEAMNQALANDMRALEAALVKMSELIGADVKTGYRFETPFLEASFGRDKLEEIIEYTLDHDQTFYEICMAETTARVSLNTNYDLIKSKYRKDIGMISSYVTQALNGEKVDAKVFKDAYKKFLEKIDSYWNGWIWLYYIIVPKEWFKGSLSGIRYVEDDPYVLYQNVLDYAAARVARQNAERALIGQVRAEFENYISVRNAYLNSLQVVEREEARLEADYVRMNLGVLPFEEYNDSLESFEELQDGLLEAMQLYSDTLYSFDRLTCGAVTALLYDGDMLLNAQNVGIGLGVEHDYTNGVYYYFQQVVQNEAFDLNVYVPKDFPVQITHFALFCDNVQIGAKTECGKRLRHLAVTAASVDEVKIRLYNGDTFVDDCVIDPQTASGPLPVITGRSVGGTESDSIGSYTLTRNSVTGMITITMKITEDAAVKFFAVQTKDGIRVSGTEPCATETGFTHLPAVEEGLEETEILLYDEGKNMLYKARFDVNNRLVRRVDG